MDDESGESMEPMGEVTPVGLSGSELERLVRSVPILTRKPSLEVAPTITWLLHFYTSGARPNGNDYFPAAVTFA